MSRAVYPRLNLTLDDGTVRHTTILTKRKMSGLQTELQGKGHIIKGRCRVEYSKEFFNEFDFTSGSDFRSKVEPCIEKELLDEFREV